MLQENQQVRFEEEQPFTRPSLNKEKKSFLVSLVIKLHLAKDNSGAQKVLLVVAIIAIVAAVWLFFSTFLSPVTPPKIPSNIHIPPGALPSANQ